MALASLFVFDPNTDLNITFAFGIGIRRSLSKDASAYRKALIILLDKHKNERVF